MHNVCRLLHGFQNLNHPVLGEWDDGASKEIFLSVFVVFLFPCVARRTLTELSRCGNGNRVKGYVPDSLQQSISSNGNAVWYA
jgi:hypothetical protein